MAEDSEAVATGSGEPEPDSQGCPILVRLNEYTVYRRRWYLLAVVCLLSASNAMIWIGFAPVADLSASFFNCSLDTINYLSLVYVIISIPFGFAASWLLDSIGLKHALMKNRAYVILMLCFGAGLGIVTAFSSFLEQILCFRGYPNYISGLCGALFIFFGAIGALFCGLYVDRTKKFTEVVKICFALSALLSTAFAVISNLSNQNVWLAVICSLLGFFSFSLYPISMELAVECSYPVGEGSSTGLAFISGQVQGLIFMVLLQTLTKPYAASPLSSCGVNQIEIYDWSLSTLVMAGLCSTGACVFIIFFHTDYKRLKAEANAIEGDTNTSQESLANP